MYVFERRYVLPAIREWSAAQRKKLDDENKLRNFVQKWVRLRRKGAALAVLVAKAAAAATDNRAGEALLRGEHPHLHVCL